MGKKKILLIGAICGVVVNIVTKGIEGWLPTIFVALIVGGLIGLIGGMILKNDE